MITPDGKLQIFEPFEPDESLPKFIVFDDASLPNESYGMSDSSMRSKRRRAMRRNGRTHEDSSERKSWWARLASWISGFYDRLRGVIHRPQLSVEDFFAHVKNSSEEVSRWNGRIQGYQAAIEDARTNGQHAFVELLMEDLDAVRAETQLHAIQLNHFISEATLVRFVQQSPKGLRLDYARNFTRVIPSNITAVKQRCDELGIFDEYVVLHYDPLVKSWAETEAEKRRRQDPILFGLIRGRRRLYFVGDWIDEFCDLTLEQVAERLGRDAISTISETIVIR